MKTPMVIFNDVMKKKNKKNRKGFSLVELIVVLVIMAILAAALIPSLMGYIKKTKEQNINSEAQSAVQAAQTIASGAYASANGEYSVSGYATAIKWDDIDDGTELAATSDYAKAVIVLAECPTGATAKITVSNASDNTFGRVTKLVYERDSVTVTYELDSNGIGVYKVG